MMMRIEFLLLSSLFLVVILRTIFFSETLCIFFKKIPMAFLLYYVYPLSFCEKNGEYFCCFWTGNVFPNWSSVFCPRMAKDGVC
jgi:hypothetical protein